MQHWFTWLRWQMRLLMKPVLFDRGFYVEKNLGRKPFRGAYLHFLFVGSWKGFTPHPCFDTIFYERSLGFVRVANPYWHYKLKGSVHGLSPSPFFEPEYYVNQAPRLAIPAGVSALEHFLLEGSRAGRDPSPIFKLGEYLEYSPDVAQIGAEALTHFLAHGRFENRPWTGVLSGQQRLNEILSKDLYLAAELARGLCPVDPTVLSRSQRVLTKISSLFDEAKQQKLLFFEMPSEKVSIQSPQNLGQGARTLPSGEWDAPPVYVSRFRNASIFGGARCVWTSDGKMLHDEIAADKTGEYHSKPHYVAKLSEDHYRISYLKKNGTTLPKGILITCEHDPNYFHWFAEVLPKVLLAEAANIPSEVPFLIPKGLLPNLMKGLEAVNTTRRKCIPLDLGVLYRVNDLYYPSDLSRIFDRYVGSIRPEDCILSPEWIRRAIAQLKTSIRGTAPLRPRTRKIYLSRRNGSYRKPANEAAIEEMLFDMGFEILDINGATLSLQCKTFEEASIVVAPTGAACTNLFFCQPGTRFIILSGNHPSCNFYVFNQLGTIFDIDLTFLLGDEISKISPQFAVHDDYRIDLDLLRQLVLQEENSDSRPREKRLPSKLLNEEGMLPC